MAHGLRHRGTEKGLGPAEKLCALARCSALLRARCLSKQCRLRRLTVVFRSRGVTGAADAPPESTATELPERAEARADLF